MVDKNIFRAYDIRGVFGDNLTPEVMLKIGMALGKFMKDNKKGDSVLVGNDVRTSSIPLSKAFISGLLASGMNVTDVGINPFGITLFSGWKLGKDVTAYITDSHLPPEWNGVKFYYGEGNGFLDKENYEIGRIVDEVEFNDVSWENIGNLDRVDMKEDYIDFMKESFPSLKRKNYRIVVDCGNGTMSLSAPQILESLGFEVVKVFCDVDPSFPNRTMEPVPKNLGKLKETVIEEKADLGVAFDGDGDRATLIDDKGRFLTNEMGIIIAKYMIKEKGSNVIATMACSMNVDKELEPLGSNIIRVPVGHSYVVQSCKEYSAIIGMEETGHIAIPYYFLFDDAMIIPLKIAEIMGDTGKKLSELLDEIEKFPFEEIVFKCSDDDKFEIIEKVKRIVVENYENVNTVDGVKVNFDNGWVMIRASNTSPKIRLYVEATTEKKFDELKKEFCDLMEREMGYAE